MCTLLEEIDMTIHDLETQEVLETLDTFFQKQAPGTRQIKTEASCLPGLHSHPGRTCHKVDEHHKGKVVQQMGGEQAYFATHPFARPKKKAQKRRGVGKKATTPKGKSLSEKWFDNTDTEALLSNEYASVEERQEALLGTVAEQWHDTIKFNEEVLTQPDLRIFATSESWLFSYVTTNPKTGKENPHVVYSKNHLEKSEQEKWVRLKVVAGDIGRIRSYADQLLSDSNPQNQAIGVAIQLLDVTGFRVGGEKYVEENGTYGITSLERGHVKLLSGNRVQLSFVGKAGVSVERRKFSISPKLHQHLADITKGRQDRPLIPINDGHVRRALEPFGIKPKDLRTYKVNMLLVQALNSGPQYKSNKPKREEQLKKVVKDVAEEIGHGPSVSRKSYMHETLLRSYLDGHVFPSLEMLFKQNTGDEDADDESENMNYDRWITAEERRFIDYLKNIHLV